MEGIVKFLNILVQAVSLQLSWQTAPLSREIVIDLSGMLLQELTYHHSKVAEKA
jgi:hypothetical protein